MIFVNKLDSLTPVKNIWDTLIFDYFQSSAFLGHLEKYNNCFQRYYVLREKNELKAAAIVYTLPVNLLTFSSKSFNIKMNVIGVPASVDSSGLIGNKSYFEPLVENILNEEKGFVLCLNYESLIKLNSIVQLNALPTVIFKHSFDTFDSYLSTMRSHYRRRALIAIQHFQDIRTEQDPCSSFTDNHYELYLNIMSRTKTKLEILTKDFFIHLPSNFSLTSYYFNNELVTWHITCEAKTTFAFLFGGINYKQRDKFDAYYNNLLGIIKEGLEKGYKTINLGQTAEIPKMRLGGQLVSKKMFIFHRNWIIRKTLSLFKNQLEYKAHQEILKVFKCEHSFL